MSTASFGRCKSGDRFYNPPGRRQLQNQQQLLKQKQHQTQEFDEIRRTKQQIQHQNHYFNQNQDKDAIRGDKPLNQNQNQNHYFNQNQQIQRRKKAVDAAADGRGNLSKNQAELDDCVSTSATAVSSSMRTMKSKPVSLVSSSSSTNLERFLEYTTPSVPAQHFSRTSMERCQTQEEDFRSFFVLGDLWESFKEWSAYGAGVPLLLNGSDTVVQYYVPYLSGIQLYIDPLKPSPKTRMPGEESDESFRETSSDGSSDCEIERGPNSFGVLRSKEVTESNLQGMKGLSLQSQPLNNSSSDDGESSSSRGDLIFEYFEHDPPFSREPLADKILLLSSRFPQLKTYRSCDLSLASWISVAWYPIYRIPTGPTLQNLESCFLTFHHLSTPLSGGQNDWQSHFGSCSTNLSNHCETSAAKLPIPIFGMASYKFKVSMWDQNGVDESPKANSLLQAADEWLRHLNVNHPDYRFFASHKFYWR